MTTPDSTGAEHRLGLLIARLLESGEAAAAAGSWEQARATAEDVLTVDPGNVRAEALVARADVAEHPRAGQRALMTILFSDLVDSTPIAEAADPEVLRDLYSLYRATSLAAMDRFGGEVVKFLGDGIVAAFGYPVSHEDDARRAVLAGLALLEGIQETRRVAAERHDIDVEVRVGIHTGLVVVADLGEGKTRERDSIVGVTPNMASRLQSEAEPGMVVISDVTRHLIDPDFQLRSLGMRTLKGISRDVEVFAVEGQRHVGARLASERYSRGLVIGRDDALSVLTSQWEAAEAASRSPGGAPTRAVFLVGEAGIGKSRVVADVRTRVERDGGDILEVGCLPYYADSPFWPIGRLLERVLDVRPETSVDERRSRLVDRLTTAGVDPRPAVAVLGTLIGVPESDEYPLPQLDPAALRQITIATLADWLGRLPAGRARLGVAEDVEWADPSTLELLGHLAQHPPPGVLTVMTSRDHLETPWADRVLNVPLDRLDDDAAIALVDSVGGSSLPQTTKESIAERAEGIPLFIEELVHTTLDSPDADVVPMRLQELLTARLHTPGLDLRIAQIAAAAGLVFDAEVVEDVAGNAAHARSQLGKLVDAAIIDPWGDADRRRYRFRHALVRDAAYETQLLETRRDIHARIAAVLLAGDADPAVTARHLDLGALPAEAIGQYLAATQAAQAAGAHVEATRLASRALELVADLPADPGRSLTELTARMLRALSVSSVQGYAAPEVLDDYQHAEELTDELGSAPEAMPAVIAIWSYRLVNGDVGTAARLVERLVRMTGTDTGAWFAAEVDSCAGFQALYEGDLGRAAIHLERAVSAFEARPDDAKVSPFWPLPNDPVAVSASAYSSVLALTGHLDESAHWQRRAIERAESVPFPQGPFTVAFVRIYQAWLEYLLGDAEAAQAHGEAVTAIGREHGFAYWVALGSIFHRISDPDIVEYQQTLATLRAIGHAAFMPSYLGLLAVMQAAEGDHPAAIHTLDEALAAGDAGEELHTPELLRMKAVCLVEIPDRTSEAAAALERAVELADAQGSSLLALRAAVDLARLPDSVRPADWAATLRRQADRLPADAAPPELVDARTLLAG